MKNLILLLSSFCAILSLAQSQKILRLHVDSDIQSRFAVTNIRSEIRNTGNTSREIQFEAQLPGDAFISNFTMTINGVMQVGEVKKKSEAKEEYEKAKSSGHTAGLVEQKPRETDLFRTSVNVAAGGKVKFHLTYQEVLKRVHGVYKHVVNILSHKEVEELKIRTRITERGRISKIHVPEFGPKVGEKTNKELLALPQNPDVDIRNTVDVNGVSSARISYEPTNKVAGQLAVLYDLERAYNGGDIEVIDGYFVHFFAPQRDDTQTIGATNIVFVLDQSGSMQGRKFDQLQDAMKTILKDLKTDDRFSIVYFSTGTTVWDENLRPATKTNVDAALDYVKRQRASGGTNVHGALSKGLEILRNDKDKTGSTSPNMILFLTDGLPTAGEIQGGKEIRTSIESQNRNLEAKIHCLAFGSDADYKMLQKMSSENDGLARKIYEASDASLQLEGFYSEIASPIFTNMDVKYLDGKVNHSSLVKNRNDGVYYKGSEVMIVGKLRNPTITTLKSEIKATSASGRVIPFRCGNECFSCCRGICPRWCSPWPCPRPPIILTPVTTTPTPPLPSTTLRGFVERMWAYMTIKNLLKDAKLEDDATEKKKKEDEALELSLKYNFVTEQTSMVVVDKAAEVKPFEEEKDREDADSTFSSSSRIMGMAHGGGGSGFYRKGSRGGLSLGGAFGPPGRISSSGNSNSISGLPGMPAPRPRPPPPSLPLATRTVPSRTTTITPTPSTTITPPINQNTNQCKIKLLIVAAESGNSSFPDNFILHLLRSLEFNSISASVSIATISPSNQPSLKFDFTPSHNIKKLNLSNRNSLRTKTFPSVYRNLKKRSGDRRVVVVFGGERSLSTNFIRTLNSMKGKGVEIIGFHTMDNVPEVSKNQLESITGNNKYFDHEDSVPTVADALRC